MRTTLGKRIAEARESYRELKIAEYRAALKMKRAAVRASIMVEVNRERLRKLQESKTRLLELAMGKASQAREGIAVRPPQPPPSPRITSAKSIKDVNKVKKNLVTEVAELIPERVRNTTTGHLIHEVTNQVAKDAKVDAHSGSVAAQMVASIAVDTDMNEKQLVELVDSLHWDSDEIKETVKQNVLNELRKAKRKC